MNNGGILYKKCKVFRQVLSKGARGTYAFERIFSVGNTYDFRRANLALKYFRSVLRRAMRDHGKVGTGFAT